MKHTYNISKMYIWDASQYSELKGPENCQLNKAGDFANVPYVEK